MCIALPVWARRDIVLPISRRKPAYGILLYGRIVRSALHRRTERLEGYCARRALATRKTGPKSPGVGKRRRGPIGPRKHRESGRIGRPTSGGARRPRATHGLRCYACATGLDDARTYVRDSIGLARLSTEYKIQLMWAGHIISRNEKENYQETTLWTTRLLKWLSRFLVINNFWISKIYGHTEASFS